MNDQQPATRLADGRVRVAIDGETVEASPSFWRAVLFDLTVLERVRPVVTAHLREPIVSRVWWNGDGR
jgi:hypothetical protein